MNAERNLAPEWPFKSPLVSSVKYIGSLVFIKSMTIDNITNIVEANAINKSIPNNIFSIIF